MCIVFLLKQIIRLRSQTSAIHSALIEFPIALFFTFFSKKVDHEICFAVLHEINAYVVKYVVKNILI